MVSWFRPSNLVQTQVNEPLWLIVLEAEANALDFQPSTELGTHAVVIGQIPGQSRASLAEHVVSRISDLECAGRKVEHAIIRIVPCDTQESMNARARIARALLAHSALFGASELLFVVKSGASPALRGQILELVQELIGYRQSVPLRIRVSFGDAAVPVREGTGAYPTSRAFVPTLSWS